MNAASSLPASSQAANGIADQRFTEQLNVIKKLKKFLFEERLALPPDILEGIDLGALNNLTSASNGRLPTENEWKALDEKLAKLAPLLTPALRWKFRIRGLRFFFITVPIIHGTVGYRNFVAGVAYHLRRPRVFLLRCALLSRMDSLTGRSRCLRIPMRHRDAICAQGSNDFRPLASNDRRDRQQYSWRPCRPRRLICIADRSSGRRQVHCRRLSGLHGHTSHSADPRLDDRHLTVHAWIQHHPGISNLQPRCGRRQQPVRHLRWRNGSDRLAVRLLRFVAMSNPVGRTSFTACAVQIMGQAGRISPSSVRKSAGARVSKQGHYGLSAFIHTLSKGPVCLDHLVIRTEGL